MPVTRQQTQSRKFDQFLHNSFDTSLNRYVSNEEHDKLLHEKKMHALAEKEAYEKYVAVRNRATNATAAYTQYKNDKNNNAGKILDQWIKNTKYLLQDKSINRENVERLKLRLAILSCNDGVDIIEILERHNLFKNYELPFDGVVYRIPTDEWYAMTLITTDEVNILSSVMDPSGDRDKYIKLCQHNQCVEVGALWWNRPKDWLK